MEYNFPTLNRIQRQYADLLTKYQPFVIKEELSSGTILKIIDEIEIFWRRKLDLLIYGNEKRDSSTESLLLSGAVYLDIEEFEHYYFKLFGDYHAISDPLLKMEPFFRMPDNKFVDENSIRIFKTAFQDTLNILNNTHNTIQILPTREMLLKYETNKSELIEKFYWVFISSILKTDIAGKQEFYEKFNTISDIESQLDDFILKNLIYIDSKDTDLDLEQRCERYKHEYTQFKGISNIDIFNIATFSYVAQTIDILLTNLALGFTPYIRHDVTFRYFLLLKDTFNDDEQTRLMIEKSIIINIMYNTIPLELLTKHKYEEYIKLLKGEKLLDKVLAKLKELNVNIIYHGGVKRAQEIILEEVNKVLLNQG
ncbi:hypothetical protein [Bacillus sp. REN16]|uniref:hypothetical protein n=1 Tax=Bacillus sp. REN16 TaxID=2887296 RepID=UPI001E530C9D|nr:hypothetical protein [Bacillus sp. REN16]MCC3358190.1 hypothetical protein [Bacillus sp. REN16]